jgi:hypothetical protein
MIYHGDMMLYFAYGSNMHTARLRERVPSSTFRAVAALPGHALRFHKRGRDGSAKCDAYASGRPTDAVHGVVFALAAAERPALDRAEGSGYCAAPVLLHTSSGATLNAYTYLAVPAAIDAALLPFRWYLDLVVAGAYAHGLPAAYVARLAETPAHADPDTERATRHTHLLRS